MSENVDTNPLNPDHPSNLDGAPEIPLPGMVMAVLWHRREPVELEFILSEILRAGRKVSAAKLAACLVELTAKVEKDPIYPVRLVQAGSTWRLVGKAYAADILKSGFKLPNLDEVSLDVLTCILYWPHEKPPTRSQLQYILNLSDRAAEKALDYLGSLEYVYGTQIYDSYTRYRPTREVLDRFGAKSLSDLPRYAQLTSELKQIRLKDIQD